MQGLYPLDPPFAELFIMQLLIQNDLDDPGQQGRIFPRSDLQMDIGTPRRLGSAGIHTDDLDPPLLVVAQTFVRTEGGKTPKRRIIRDHGVVSDHHGNV